MFAAEILYDLHVRVF